MHIGQLVRYTGKALNFPRTINHIIAKLLSIVDDAVFLETSNGEIIFGLLTKDCFPMYEVEFELSPVHRTRPGSWT